MALVPGTRLGHYEVVAPLGAGGMGEVYRAHDTRIGRDVAVKVLPAALAQDEERLRRFEQEARAAGRLSHPNVLTVHDVGRHEGLPYVVSELLEGETLRERLRGTALPVRKAIEIAIQIARGLAAAHEQGIVHRDLKPENVFVAKDGQVKILDFGLAKLMRAEAPLEAESNLRTEGYGTDPGTVLGTVGYMSPEQVRGRPLNHRSDIFSLGAILYEMLSGRRAFAGDSSVETLNAILKEDPPELSETGKPLPPALDRIVRHCLEKSPDERFASAHDLAFDLASLSGASAPRLEPSPLPARRNISCLVVPSALLTALAAGLVGGWLIWNTGPVSNASYGKLTFRRGPVWSARFAPDGRTVFYAASWDGAQKSELFSVRVERPESLRLALPAGQVESISRGGEMLLLDVSHFSTRWARTGTLSRTPLSGSAPRDLLDDVGSADWSPDESALAVVRAPGWRYRLEFPVGKILYETTGWISHPRVSPDGNAVAFLDHPVFGDDLGSVAIVDRTGKKTTLSPTWQSVQGLAWSASGREIWFTGSEYPRPGGPGGSYVLEAVTRTGRRRTVATGPGQLTLQDISRDGRALFILRNLRFGLLGVVSGETTERDFSALDWSVLPLLSDDRKTVVFTEEGAGAGAGYSVYSRKLDGSPAVRLGEGLALAISPDGKWVLTCLMLSKPPQIVLLPTGAGEPRSFPNDSIDHAHFEEFAAFLPDGKRIVFVGHEPGRPTRVFVQDLTGGAARPVTPEGVVASLLSPDGKSLLIRTSDKGFVLTPMEGGPSRAVPGLEPEDRPLRWASDGRTVFAGEARHALPARVFRVDSETGRREVWREFRPADPAGITDVAPLAISADGKTIVFKYARALSELYIVEGLK